MVTGLSRCPGAAQDTEKTQIFVALIVVSSPAPGFADSREKLGMCRSAEREPKARQGLTLKPHSSPHAWEVNPLKWASHFQLRRLSGAVEFIFCPKVLS